MGLHMLARGVDSETLAAKQTWAGLPLFNLFCAFYCALQVLQGWPAVSAMAAGLCSRASSHRGELGARERGGCMHGLPPR